METMTLFGIVARGGILMIPIFICSVIVVAVALERYFTYRRVCANVPQLMMKIRYPLSRGDFAAAANEAALVKGPVANVVRAGIEKAGFGREHAREAMEAAGSTETFHLEKNLNVLATLAGITPLIGFLGTVTGMIKAFMKIQQLAGNVNADVLAGGIWEAMVTTAAGLLVGIPAMIVYNYYVHRVRSFTHDMEVAGNVVLEHIGVPAQGEEPAQSAKPAAPAAPPAEIPAESAPQPPDSHPHRKNTFPGDDRLRIAERPSLSEPGERPPLFDPSESFDPEDLFGNGGKAKS